MIHKTCEFYKKVYAFSFKVSKRNRLGIFVKIEAICLEIISLVITAAFEPKNQKLGSLYSARIKIELLKRLFRLIYELKIIGSKFYLDFESDLQEISKMINGWIKYLR